MTTSTDAADTGMQCADAAKEALGELIAEHRFFNGINPEFLSFLAENASKADFKPGALILSESAEARSFHLITWGSVGLEVHIPGKRQITVQRVGVGEALGWSWFFPPHTWRFTARALTPTQAISFNVAALREHANANHDFGYDLAVRMGQLMHERLKAACALLEDYCK